MHEVIGSIPTVSTKKGTPCHSAGGALFGGTEWGEPTEDCKSLKTDPLCQATRQGTTKLQTICFCRAATMAIPNVYRNHSPHTGDLLLIIFFKQIIRRTFQNIAYRLQIIKFYRIGFIIHNSIKILITKPKLNIQPILCSALFLQNI